MNEHDRESIHDFEARLRAEAAACRHQHVGIEGPTPWRLNSFVVQCLDCCAVMEWPQSGAKTRAETVADIRAWLRHNDLSLSQL